MNAAEFREAALAHLARCSPGTALTRYEVARVLRVGNGPYWVGKQLQAMADAGDVVAVNGKRSDDSGRPCVRWMLPGGDET